MAEGGETGSEPQYKAGVLHGLLDAIEHHPRGEACLAACDQVKLALIRSTFRSDWIPVSDGLCLYECAYAAGGPELLFDVARSNAVRQGKVAPLFRPLLRGTLNLFGGGPLPLFKTLGRALAVSTRHNGAIVELVADENNLRYDWIDVPPVLRNDVYVQGQRGTSVGLLDLLDMAGSCDAEDERLRDEGRCRFIVRW